MKTYHPSNFFKHTYCEFEQVNDDFFLNNKPQYISKSGSSYFYTEEGVYRYSNHWGRVANCRWKISGIENYKNQSNYVGYSSWLNFYPLSNFDKAFYLKQDSENDLPKIYRIKEDSSLGSYLMTLEFAQKRLKQIKALFKDYKWAQYYSQDIEIVRKELISKLINSEESLQKLKHSLRNDFK